MMTASEVRAKFLEFFEQKGHKIVPSAPIVLKDDPTLMFTNAGMNQFKDYFLGTQEAEVKRITDTQKCLRVSGKHNDLEEVGVDTYHHTMFEMLGNWSFGDYFKKEAIEWSWELLVDVYGLPVDRLYVTVFEGDASDGLEEDSEAYDFWNGIVSEDKILKCSKKDNFWEMGEQGPCGPSSEIHIDLRPQLEIDAQPGAALVNADHDQVIEIWNLVFIQYNRKANGSLDSLPSKHVDTGMGFERLCRVIQGKSSNYDTDIFMPMINEVEKLSGITYGKNLQNDIAIRVIVDHVRALTFAIADGQLPSNTGAGYVIRRILRRAIRYGFTFLKQEEAFIYSLVDILSDQFEHVFPEVSSQKDFIKKVVQEEEKSFLRTLKSGISRMEALISEAEASGKKVIDGKIVFELYDTYGFPVDLTGLIARENDMSIDEAGFRSEMEVQKNRSRSASESSSDDWVDVAIGSEVEFVGYDLTETETRLLRYREVKDKKGTKYQLVLEKTPFYAESGGQVGDRGMLLFGDEKIPILSTLKENNLIIHLSDKLPTNLEGNVSARIDITKRLATTNNHSATHLLQSALREVLGDHITQKGSLVNEKQLRFDFSHFSKLEKEEISAVERIVNEKIRSNIQLNEQRNVPVQQALDSGATALFGEKYGDEVRVITFDSTYSVELCGGTHVPSTSVIGSFKIITESSISAGVRRIEAVTASKADEFVQHKVQLLDEVEELLKRPKDLKKHLESMISEKSEMAKKLEYFRAQESKSLASELKTAMHIENGVSQVIQKVKVESADTLKQVAFEMRKNTENLFMVLAAEVSGKPQIAIMLSDNLVEERELNAGKMVRELAKEIKGGGGGQAFFATAGGSDAAGLDAVILKAKSFLN